MSGIAALVAPLPQASILPVPAAPAKPQQAPAEAAPQQTEYRGKKMTSPEVMQLIKNTEFSDDEEDFSDSDEDCPVTPKYVGKGSPAIFEAAAKMALASSSSKSPVPVVLSPVPVPPVPTPAGCKPKPTGAAAAAVPTSKEDILNVHRRIRGIDMRKKEEDGKFKTKKSLKKKKEDDHQDDKKKKSKQHKKRSHPDTSSSDSESSSSESDSESDDEKAARRRDRKRAKIASSEVVHPILVYTREKTPVQPCSRCSLCKAAPCGKCSACQINAELPSDFTRKLRCTSLSCSRMTSDELSRWAAQQKNKERLCSIESRMSKLRSQIIAIKSDPAKQDRFQELSKEQDALQKKYNHVKEVEKEIAYDEPPVDYRQFFTIIQAFECERDKLVRLMLRREGHDLPHTVQMRKQVCEWLSTSIAQFSRLFATEMVPASAVPGLIKLSKKCV